ncbi:MAG: GGDEF domain-containing protein [Treponema sp.]|nr:GGDEF domain-containing protein [Treponema sp.]
MFTNNLSHALNATIGSSIIITLIFLNYFRKYNTDNFKRSLFCIVLVFYLTAIMTDLLLLLLNYYSENRQNLRIIIIYSPILFLLAGILISRLFLKKPFIPMFFFLIIFFFISAAIDHVFPATFLSWTFGSSSLLYAYFFIVQSDEYIDPLTGIGNRSSINKFTAKLSNHITNDLWAIVMIDMDHFKAINDTLGHQEGDRALCDIASIFKKCLKTSDFIARYGGDEFLIITKVIKNEEKSIKILMDNIQTSVDRFNADIIRPFVLEISYGYDIFAQDGKQSIDDFLKHIDNLMYKHKLERRRLSDRKTEDAG